MIPTLRLLASASSSSTTTNATRTAAANRLLRNKSKPPSLEQFLHRQKVIALWRLVAKNLYRIPKSKRDEPLRYARGEFERNKHVTDPVQVRYLVSTGKAEFDSMRRYIDELAAAK